jgi:GDP-L-fucose synthase
VRATVHRRDPHVDHERIEYLRCDLTRGEECRRAVEGQRYVFHCAASTAGAAAMVATPMAHVTPNVLMHTQLLEAAYDAKVEKLLWVGSTTGYPPSGPRPVTEDEMFAGEPFDRYFFVGWMARFTEVLCRMYGERLARPMPTIVLRATNVYGPRDDFETATSHVIPALVRKVVERQHPLEVWGDGRDVRDFLYVDDLVEAMLRAMERCDAWVTLNVGAGRGHTVREVLDLLLEIDGYRDARVEFNSDRPSMIPIRLVDTGRARAQLGFTAATGLREGLARTLAWYRQEASPRP